MALEQQPLMHARAPYSSNETSREGSEVDYSIDTPPSPMPYNVYSDWREKEKEKIEAGLPSPMKARRRRAFLLVGTSGVSVVAISICVFLLLTRIFSSGPKLDGKSKKSFFMNYYTEHKAGPGTFPLSLQNSKPSDMCSICDCHAAPAFYAPAKNFQSEYAPRPLQRHVYPSSDSIDTNEFMRQTILDIYCARQHIDHGTALKLLRRSANSLGEMMSWSLAGLEFGKPTIYLTTATSPNGKAGPLRPQYFRRHGRAIRSWMSAQTAAVQRENPDWQVVWIVAEDDIDIDPTVVRTLRRTGVSYVYYAYGLTQSWGNAQKNANMQVVYAMSRSPEYGGIFGHGPVYGLDDDNKIQPDLLGMLTRVERIGVVPMGNLGADMWERPVVNELGELQGSQSLWQWGRKYAFDFGGFAFNSSLLGTVISGPMFWKHKDFAGESEFIDQVVGNIHDIEPLCGRQQEKQECHLVWHNEPLLELEKMTDDEEVAYVKKFGADHLFQQLGLQAIEWEKFKPEWYQPPIPS